MLTQEDLRQAVKRIKWQEGISYKLIAEDLLDMSTNSFYNFVNGYCNLGYERSKKLEGYINDMEDY